MINDNQQVFPLSPDTAMDFTHSKQYITATVKHQSTALYHSSYAVINRPKALQVQFQLPQCLCVETILSNTV